MPVNNDCHKQATVILAVDIQANTGNVYKLKVKMSFLKCQPAVLTSSFIHSFIHSFICVIARGNGWTCNHPIITIDCVPMCTTNKINPGPRPIPAES